MDNNIDQLSNKASEILQEVRGLKRLDKLFETKQKNITGVRFTMPVDNKSSAINVLDAIQSSGIDLAIIEIPEARDNHDNSFWYEALTEFRKQIYIPVMLEMSASMMMAYGIEKCCQHAASLAIDGFTIAGIDDKVFINEYRAFFDKYGLSFSPQLNSLNDSGSYSDPVTIINGFIYLRESENGVEVRDSANDTSGFVLLEIRDAKDEKMLENIGKYNGGIITLDSTEIADPREMQKLTLSLVKTDV